MFSMVIEKCKFMDVNITLKAMGKTSREAQRFEVSGITDKGDILLGFVTEDLKEALNTFCKWKGKNK